MRWRQWYTDLRRNNEKIWTNYLSYNYPDDAGMAIQNSGGYATVIKETEKNSMYFVTASMESFADLVKQAPGNTVINYAYRTENDLMPLAEAAGLEKYATYLRSTICYHSNPYLEKEIPRRQVLQKMYDPECGEVPVEKDIPELNQLCHEVFDPLCDDVFNDKEWKEIIDNKEILVYREAGEITAFYIFRYEGKKLYSNMSVNIGGANTLYNMERRVFEEAWDKGIRVFYGWGNLDNHRAHTHATPDDIVKKCAKNIEHLYCDTFYKQ